MRKLSIYRLATYSTIVFVSMALFNWKILTANSTESNQSVIRQIHYKNTIAQSSGNWLLDRIISLFTPSHRSGGSRGDDSVCSNSPSFDKNTPYLWTRQPLLAWSGSASSLQIVDSQSNKIVWYKFVDSSLKFGKMYIDKPLALGKKYRWQVISDPNNNVVNPSIEFQMVSINQHQKINITLKKLEKQLAVKTANYEETILAKAKYFADQKMWGDVQILLLELPESSSNYEEVNKVIKKMQNTLGKCLQTGL
jgi:Domain of Unknown Function (DUF928)